jgi:uncharacterized protein YodC (DUF2158 family)
MATEEFEIGDVVILNSGSPKMTVEGFDSRGYVTCSFWNTDKFGQTSFHQDSLKKVTGDDNKVNDNDGPISADHKYIIS